MLYSLDKPPKVLVSASATGYYGDRGEEMLTEDSHNASATSGSFTSSSTSSNASKHSDFLSYVCRGWEESTHIAKESGIRVVNLRMGTVISSSGGML